MTLALLAGIAHAERRENTLDHKRALVERRPRVDFADEDGEYRAVSDLGDARIRVAPPLQRCRDALVDPIPTPLRDAATDAQRSACLRTELSVHLGGSALIDTPGFHGELDGALQLGGRVAVRPYLELSASVRALRYTFVQNAVNKGTELQFGPLVLGAAVGTSQARTAWAFAGTLEVPFTRDNTDTQHLTGALTALSTLRLTHRTTLHGRLGFVGARAWSLGGSTGRLAFRAGADVVRRLGRRWAFDVGAEIQAGWYDGYDGTTVRLGLQRRFGQSYRGMLGVGLPLGGDERTNAVIVLGIARDLD